MFEYVVGNVVTVVGLLGGCVGFYQVGDVELTEDFVEDLIFLLVPFLETTGIGEENDITFPENG